MLTVLRADISYMSKENDNSGYPNINIENGIIISVVNDKGKSYFREVKFRNYHKTRRKKFYFLCKSQTNSLLLILGVYVVIFLVASVILIASVLKLQDLNENEKTDKNFSPVATSENLYKFLYNSKLNSVDNTFSRTVFKEFMWPYRNSLFNCSNLREVTKFTYVMSGWTKNVFSFEYDGKQYALKTINNEGTAMKKCQEKQSNKICFNKASSKLYKEYILSRELSHNNIIKVLAWCVSNSNYSNHVAIVSELCTPVDLVSLLRMSFQQRLKIVVDLSHLMAFLSESPLGSVAINDFQRQQFVMCGETLKLTDLDDLSIEEPKCFEHSHCLQNKLLIDLQREHKQSEDLQLKCVNNICLGHNEKQNIINTYKHFVNLFLNITTPRMLKEDLNAFFNTYISKWNAKAVLKEAQILLNKFNNLKKIKSESIT